MERNRAIQVGHSRTRSKRPLRSHNRSRSWTTGMDQETLVKEQLDQLGRRIIAALNDKDMPVVLAAWLHSANDGKWQLIIASPNVETQGPLAVFRVIQQELAKEKLPVPLSAIGVIKASDPVVRKVQTAYPSHPTKPAFWSFAPSTSIASVTSSVSTGPIDALYVYPPSGQEDEE